jgi:hypothetical protein
MNAERIYAYLQWTSRVVLALMGVALLYAAVISIVHWPGITV